MRLFWAAVLLLMVSFGATAASVGGIEMTENQLARYHELNAELRCLICQNRTIAESDAPLAKDLRDIVARQLAAGRSDQQIKQYLVDRYGEWVLYDPPFQTATLILWLGPFVLLLVGLIIVATIVWRRKSEPTPAPTLDRERLARVLASEQMPARTDSTAAKDRS